MLLRRRKGRIVLVVLFLIGAGAAGCGQKGALYLPPEQGMVQKAI